ncbi:DNA polymerase III subunit gamma and tau [Cellulomonas sp. HZM]|uniref:DNA polymerase III subunit gamma and tau n=1 Tax=Cellulomonas sp. HZM TaxID=1454010 RepID=UPI0004936790|nr:DNA polymerase III subunit gamma and tau [Cellulomonas sp. HZM]
MTTALYRRYRPETFAEVIGQDHVTAPLRQALRSGQVNHAYLFSGPRGCGKTTSARILARILNCAQNTAESPTDTPCGACESCVELARGGPGSLDVVEIDAASHGGVDDARELRERATFAPARDRFKIFILDEAHMVSPQGFNALLKIVEEPPPHVKFVFATTEPDKVIGTIRSRTHHYPFRLVPPDVLVPYLDQLCARENVPVGSGVLPLVVRAGGGSVRDTLSVLDQLIAGAGDGGLEYAGAAALLGYTQASLLDDLVEAIAARDGASAFRVVERVISTGHEPRRFVEDLLERLRDLIVIAASGDAADAVLRDVPADQMEAMRVQAAHLGPSELSRSADLANAALTEMTGATSPRLHLELLMARLLLPAVDDERAGIGARLDRLERDGVAAGPRAPGQVGAGGAFGAVPDATAPGTVGSAQRPPVAGGSAAAARAALAEARGQAPVPAPAPTAAAPTAPAPTAPAPTSAAPTSAAPEQEAKAGTTLVPERSPMAGSGSAPEPVAAERSADLDPETKTSLDTPLDAGQESAAPPAPVPAPAPEPTEARTDPVPTAPAATGSASTDTEVLRRRWPEVLETVKGLRRVTWALVDPRNAQVAELDATTLRLAFDTAALATTFRNGGHPEVVARAVRETLGFEVRVEGVLASESRAQPSATPPSPAPTDGTPGAAGADTSSGRDVPAAPSAGSAPVAAAPPAPASPAPAPSAAAPQRAQPTQRATSTPLDRPSAVRTPEQARAAASWDDVPPGEPPADEHPDDDPWAQAPPDEQEEAPSSPASADAGRSTPPPWDVPDAPPRASGAAAQTGRTPAQQSARERGTAAAMSAAARARESAAVQDEPSPDDPDIASSGLVGAPLVAQLLGGTVIDEQVDDPTG